MMMNDATNAEHTTYIRTHTLKHYRINIIYKYKKDHTAFLTDAAE